MSGRIPAQASVAASTVTFAPGPSSSISLAPWVKNPGAPASSFSICASRWQRIAPDGGHSAARARQLAAVPVAPRAPRPRFEQIGESAVETRAPCVAVIGGVEAVGLDQRGEHGRAGGGGIVGEEAHRGRHGAAIASRSIAYRRMRKRGPAQKRRAPFSNADWAITSSFDTLLNVVPSLVPMLGHRGNRGDGDEGGNQTIFDRRRTALVT